MRNYCKTIGALVAVSAFAAGNVSAEDLELNYNLHAGYTNEYIFRGVNLGQDLTEVGADVSAEWNGLGLSAGAWYGSYEAPITGAPGFTRNEDELDLYAEVSKDLGFLTASVGYIYYYNQQGSFNNAILKIDDAQEVYFSIARDFGVLEASLTHYWDIEGNNNGYTELALGKSFELTGCLALNVGTALGYLVEEGQLGHLTTKVALDWSFAEHAKLSPFVAGTVALSDDNDTQYLGSKNQFVGGAIVSVSF